MPLSERKEGVLQSRGPIEGGVKRIKKKKKIVSKRESLSFQRIYHLFKKTEMMHEMSLKNSFINTIPCIYELVRTFLDVPNWMSCLQLEIIIYGFQEKKTSLESLPMDFC